MPAAKTWGSINSLAIAAPSDFQEDIEIIGGYNTTLQGRRRRYIKATKKIWRLRYNLLSTDDYDEFYTEFGKEVPSGLQASDPNTTFTINDARMRVNNEAVHMDMNNRNVIPGTDYLSDVQITLSQV